MSFSYHITNAIHQKWKDSLQAQHQKRQQVLSEIRKHMGLPEEPPPVAEKISTSMEIPPSTWERPEFRQVVSEAIETHLIAAEIHNPQASVEAVRTKMIMWDVPSVHEEKLNIFRSVLRSVRIKVEKFFGWLNPNSQWEQWVIGGGIGIAPGIADMIMNIQPGMGFILTIALAHLIAALLLPAHAFDRTKEQFHKFILSLVPGLVFGNIIAAMAANYAYFIDIANTTENLTDINLLLLELITSIKENMIDTPSLSLSAIAAVVYAATGFSAYLGAGGMSRTIRFYNYDSAMQRAPVEIRELCGVLSEERFHILAMEWERAMLEPNQKQRVEKLKLAYSHTIKQVSDRCEIEGIENIDITNLCQRALVAGIEKHPFDKPYTNQDNETGATIARPPKFNLKR